MDEFKPGQRYLVTDSYTETNNIIEITNITEKTAFYKTIIGKPHSYSHFDFGSNFAMRLRPVKSDEITITRHGDKVVAKYGKKVGVAKCSPDDTFDFVVGAKLAFKRLMGDPEDKPEPKQKFKRWDFVRVIGGESSTHNFSLGSIVQIAGSIDSNSILCYGLVKGTIPNGYRFDTQIVPICDLEPLPENTHAD